MMGRESNYFTLSLESLRVIGGWAADCAERVVSVYETRADADTRPRAAIEGIREFAAGGKRTARLRSLALAAHAAAREAGASEVTHHGDSLLISSRSEDRLAILQALEAAGGRVARFATEEPSLEDTYLRYINAESLVSE